MTDTDGEISICVTLSIPCKEYDEWWPFDYKIRLLGEYDDFPIIGKGQGHIIPNPDNFKELVDLADAPGQSCYELVAGLDRDLLENEIIFRIITIESMQIDKGYRGKGAGLQAMAALLQFFDGDLVLILPHPLNDSCPEEEIEKVTKKIQKYWVKCGFKRMGNKKIFYHL